LVWLIAQHFLFGLIGTAVNVGNIQPSTAGMYSSFFTIRIIISKKIEKNYATLTLILVSIINMTFVSFDTTGATNGARTAFHAGAHMSSPRFFLFLNLSFFAHVFCQSLFVFVLF